MKNKQEKLSKKQMGTELLFFPKIYSEFDPEVIL